MNATLTSAAAPSRASAGSIWLWFSLGVAVLLFGLLIGPRVPDDQQAAHCVVNVHLPKPFGISLHCDSPEFLRLAADPAGLLEPGNVRQMRPGLILLAALIAKPITPLFALIGTPAIKAGRPDIDPSRITSALSTQVPAYAAYMLLNLAVLAATFFCCQRIIAIAIGEPLQGGEALVVSIGLLLIACDVTKAYFWSPHTPLFNILIPTFGLYAVARAAFGAFRERSFAVLAGLITGFGVTIYATFMALIPAIVAVGLLSWLLDKSRQPKTLVNLIYFVLLAIGPMLAWFLFVRLQIGSFHSEELTSVNGAAHWIPAMYASDGIAGIVRYVLDAFWRCLGLAAHQAAPLVAVCAIIAAIALASPRAVMASLRRHAVLVLAALFLDLVTGLFYAASGDMAFRWAYALIPPLVITAGVVLLSAFRELEPGAKRLVTLACVAAAIGQIAFTLVKDGPFS